MCDMWMQVRCLIGYNVYLFIHLHSVGLSSSNFNNQLKLLIGFDT